MKKKLPARLEKGQKLIAETKVAADPEHIRTTIQALMGRAYGKHKTLKEIVIALDPPEPSADKFDGFTECIFHLPDEMDEYHTVGRVTGSATQGHTRFFSRGAEFATFVWVRRDAEKEYADLMTLAFLCHELGHVNDFEKGRYLIPGQMIDLASAESSAHIYACDMLMHLKFRVAVKVYIDNVASQHAECGSPIHEEATRKFFAHPQITTYRQYVEAGGVFTADWPEG